MRKLRFSEICLFVVLEHLQCHCDAPNRCVSILMGASKSSGKTDLPQVDHSHESRPPVRRGTGLGGGDPGWRREIRFGSDGQGSLLCKLDRFKAETLGVRLSKSDDKAGEVTGGRKAL